MEGRGERFIARLGVLGYVRTSWDLDPRRALILPRRKMAAFVVRPVGLGLLVAAVTLLALAPIRG